MKRKAVKAILCAALMALTLSMTACGGSDDAAKGADAATEEEAKEPEEEKEEPKAEEPAEEPEVEAEEPEEETEASGETLEDYLKSTPGVMEAIEEQVGGSGADGLSVTAEVKGNDFTFNFTIEDASLITDETVALLESELDANASYFEETVAQMDEVIEQEGAVQFIIKYLDPDGKVLVEKAYKAQ